MANQLQQSINQAAPQPTIDQQQLERRRLIEERQRKNQEAKRMLWVERSHTNHYTWTSQPFEYGKPIGWQGYKWVENFIGNDGNFYAAYRPNVGGPNRKLYNLVTDKWESDKYIRSVTCSGCGSYYDAIRPGLNHCPNCHTERNFQA